MHPRKCGVGKISAGCSSSFVHVVSGLAPYWSRDCDWLQVGTAAADMVGVLTSLFELINARNVDLRCLTDERSQPTAAGRSSVQPATAAALLGLLYTL